MSRESAGHRSKRIERQRGAEERTFKGEWSGRERREVPVRGGSKEARSIAGCLRGLSGRDEDEFEDDYDFGGGREGVAILGRGALFEFGTNGLMLIGPLGVKLWGLFHVEHCGRDGARSRTSRDSLIFPWIP
jgi:hypothetical protein